MSVVIVVNDILPEGTDTHYYHQAKVHENPTLLNFVLTMSSLCRTFLADNNSRSNNVCDIEKNCILLCTDLDKETTNYDGCPTFVGPSFNNTTIQLIIYIRLV